MGDKKDTGRNADRRNFLKLAGLGSSAAAVAAVADARRASAMVADEGKASGYRETDHVRTYYNSARM